MFEIIFYEDYTNSKSVKNFIDNLDYKARAKLVGIIDLLSQEGYYLREPYSKSLEDGIFELRCKISTDTTRVLYFFYIGKKIIITNGFVKKTQKTPRKYIEIAKKYRKKYLEEVEKYDKF